jgi:phosphate transport system permease protein
MAEAVATAESASRPSLLAAPEGRRARQVLGERILLGLLAASSLVAILTTIGIALSLLFETLRFLDAVPLFDFLFGLNWSPQIAIREDQVGSSGAFGVVPLLVGTGLIAAVAMTVAGPLGLFSAIFLAEYASPRARSFAKPILEILAGIPTVVYGFFAVLVVAPFVRDSSEAAGFEVSSESALAAGVVMGVMIVPIVSSIADDVISAVPQSLREGAYGLGATKSETVRNIVLPAALPGIGGALLLGVSRAIGETMIVVMAAGLSAQLTVNPLQAVTTITVQMVALLTGDQEFDSPKTLAAFALGLLLFIATLILNLIALMLVRRYQERYD